MMAEMEGVESAPAAAVASFDVDAYIGSYDGNTKLRRLEFIAKKVRPRFSLAPAARRVHSPPFPLTFPRSVAFAAAFCPS